jgi:hypothetical protein
VIIILVSIGCYSTNDYWWIFYIFLLVVILLMVIDGYSIGGYLWLLMLLY